MFHNKRKNGSVMNRIRDDVPAFGYVLSSCLPAIFLFIPGLVYDRPLLDAVVASLLATLAMLALNSQFAKLGKSWHSAMYFNSFGCAMTTVVFMGNLPNPAGFTEYVMLLILLMLATACAAVSWQCALTMKVSSISNQAVGLYVAMLTSVLVWSVPCMFTVAKDLGFSPAVVLVLSYYVSIIFLYRAVVPVVEREHGRALLWIVATPLLVNLAVLAVIELTRSFSSPYLALVPIPVSLVLIMIAIQASNRLAER